MTILLKDIWTISGPDTYKVHFARWNDAEQPLEVWVRDRQEWQGWQEYRPARDEFNRPHIFALMQFYHETNSWLFGGIFDVLDRHADRYDVRLSGAGAEFIGRLKLQSPYRGRTTRANFENHYEEFSVQEILREPYTGRSFPGYEDIDLSFDELETLVRNDRPDWKAALESVKGVYLLTDTRTGRRYVGSAHGVHGIWSRWREYVDSGHGGNAELVALLGERPTLDYSRAHFRFALLEHRASRASDDTIIGRETFWKRILLTRGEHGLNRN